MLSDTLCCCCYYGEHNILTLTLQDFDAIHDLAVMLKLLLCSGNGQPLIQAVPLSSTTGVCSMLVFLWPFCWSPNLVDRWQINIPFSPIYVHVIVSVA